MQDHENEQLTPIDSNKSSSNIESEGASAPFNDQTIDTQNDIEQIQLADDDSEISKEESRSRRVFRMFIRWTFGLLIIFGLGFLTAVFTIYTLKVDELDQSQNNLDSAEQTITQLEADINNQQAEIDSLNAQINSLDKKISELETKNQELDENQTGFYLHIALLETRADVLTAQVELYQGNSAQARVLLESANQNLTTIESLLPDDLKEVVSPLQNRLELAVGEINEDPETAIADLGILAGDLLEIENALFSE
jgi:septal ring factor EnvC (AmiA/AmiB activator)